jgi:hypothetical protein
VRLIFDPKKTNGDGFDKCQDGSSCLQGEKCGSK